MDKESLRKGAFEVLFLNKSVIIRKDLVGNARDITPTMFNYQIHADNGSMYNTPPTYQRSGNNSTPPFSYIDYNTKSYLLVAFYYFSRILCYVNLKGELF